MLGGVFVAPASNAQQPVSPPQTEAAGVSQPPTEAAGASRRGEGNELATRVLAMLERRPNIAARVRHRIRLGDEVLAGTGRYWQQGLGDERRTRLEVQTLVAGEAASLVQVFDGRKLWTDRRLPSGRSVTRLDPVRLQAAMAGTAPMARQGRQTTATSLMATAATRGGLSGQLADLVQHFDFDRPQAVQLGDMPALALIGRWKPERLQELWTEPDDEDPETANQQQGATAGPASSGTLPSLADWPRQLPHHVLLVVGRKDLFPYVIEHRGSDDAPLADSPEGRLPTANPMAQFELFEVQFAAAIDDRLFEFPHSDVQWTNETPDLIRKLGKRAEK